MTHEHILVVDDEKDILLLVSGYAFTRNELVERVLGYRYDGVERALDTHVKNLRRKLGDDPKDPVYIHTRCVRIPDLFPMR